MNDIAGHDITTESIRPEADDSEELHLALLLGIRLCEYSGDLDELVIVEFKVGDVTCDECLDRASEVIQPKVKVGDKFTIEFEVVVIEDGYAKTVLSRKAPWRQDEDGYIVAPIEKLEK